MLYVGQSTVRALPCSQVATINGVFSLLLFIYLPLLYPVQGFGGIWLVMSSLGHNILLQVYETSPKVQFQLSSIINFMNNKFV